MLNARILLVEDNDDIRFIGCEYLERHGFDVTPMTNGKNALDHLKADSNFDLIILDCAMPVMTGPQFRREQLSIQNIADIPVILLSSEPETPEIAKDLRCDGWLYKMDFNESLISEILNVLWRAGRIAMAQKRAR